MIKKRGDRRLTLWVPDWSIAALNTAVIPGTPAATVNNYRIESTTKTARVFGVRRGMPVAVARHLCEELVFIAADKQRDDSAFEAVLQIMDESLANVQAVTPGMAWAYIPRFFHSEVEEKKLISQLSEELVATLGIEAYIGVAEGMSASVAAAKRGICITSGSTQGFLRKLRIEELVNYLPEKYLREYVEIFRVLHLLGLHWVSEFLDLGLKQIVTRFGQRGENLWELANGRDLFINTHLRSDEDVTVQIEFDPFLTEIEHALVAVRKISQELVELLTQRGLQARAVQIIITTDLGTQHQRRWSLFENPDSSLIAQRIIWHLRSWQENYSADESRSIASLSLLVDEAVKTTDTDLLWGNNKRSEQAQQAIAQVQTMLGDEAVKQVFVIGGLDPRSRTYLLPWGEETDKHNVVSTGGQWAGSLNEAPIVLYEEPCEVKLIGEQDNGTWGILSINSRGVLTGTPKRLLVLEDELEISKGSHNIVSSQGPWTFVKTWWQQSSSDMSRCYLRVKTVKNADLLLVYRKGEWRLEGSYSNATSRQ